MTVDGQATEAMRVGDVLRITKSDRSAAFGACCRSVPVSRGAAPEAEMAGEQPHDDHRRNSSARACADESFRRRTRRQRDRTAVLTKLNGRCPGEDFEVLASRPCCSATRPSIEENGVGFASPTGAQRRSPPWCMAARPLCRPALPTPEIASPLRLVFVAGIPGHLQFRVPSHRRSHRPDLPGQTSVERLLAAKTATHFVDLLTAGEVRL